MNASQNTTSESKPEYGAPALDRGLDIIELLAEAAGGLSQQQIADGIGRTSSQIFRVLATLERRGYLVRDMPSGQYLLGMRLFDLAHRQQPIRGLLAAAAPELHALAEESRQSCNLAVLDPAGVRVIAQQASPADFGFQVRVGAVFSAESTATGQVLTSQKGSGTATVRVREILSSAGFLEQADELRPGVLDLVVPIYFGSQNHERIVAALTVPYISTSYSELQAVKVAELAKNAAHRIEQNLAREPRSHKLEA